MDRSPFLKPGREFPTRAPGSHGGDCRRSRWRQTKRLGPSFKDGPSRWCVAGCRGGYWTLAVSELAAFRVKVQVGVFAPPLLQTPDQITDRPLVAPRVMLVPTAKLAEPVDPTGTLSPAGVD